MRGLRAPRARCARGCAPRRAAPCAATCARTSPARALRVVSRRCSSGALLHLGLAVTGVGAKGPRRRELAELVADHLLGDEHGDVLAAVVDGNRVPDHLREDGGSARPGADHPLLVPLVHGLDATHQPLLDERPFLAGSTQHSPFTFLRAKRSPNSSTMKMRSVF